jgi:hypothetical protein
MPHPRTSAAAPAESCRQTACAIRRRAFANAIGQRPAQQVDRISYDRRERRLDRPLGDPDHLAPSSELRRERRVRRPPVELRSIFQLRLDSGPCQAVDRLAKRTAGLKLPRGDVRRFLKHPALHQPTSQVLRAEQPFT